MTGIGNGESNKPTISWVTKTICLLGIMLGASVPVLGYLDKPISTEHNTIASIVIGGILSMLTKSTPTQSSAATPEPQTVKIEQPPNDPIPVKEKK